MEQTGTEGTEKETPKGRKAPRQRTLDLHLPSLSDLGRETSLDSLDGTTRAARVAGNEVKTVLAFGQFRVRGPACLARHIFWVLVSIMAR
jgi:hypothetical protein